MLREKVDSNSAREPPLRGCPEISSLSCSSLSSAGFLPPPRSFYHGFLLSEIQWDNQHLPILPDCSQHGSWREDLASTAVKPPQILLPGLGQEEWLQSAKKTGSHLKWSSTAPSDCNDGRSLCWGQWIMVLPPRHVAVMPSGGSCPCGTPLPESNSWDFCVCVDTTLALESRAQTTQCKTHMNCLVWIYPIIEAQGAPATLSADMLSPLLLSLNTFSFF